MGSLCPAFSDGKKVDGASDTTIRNYTFELAAFGKWIGERKPESIETDDIRTYLIYLREERKLRDTTIQQYTNILRAFFNWLDSEKLITNNPMVQIKSLKIDKKSLRHSLKPDQVEALRLAAADNPRDRALLEFFLTAGCRVSEVLPLKTENVDWKKRTIQVIGKGNKKRTVVFTKTCKKYLLEWLKVSPNPELLFCSTRKPHGEMKKEGIEAIIKRLGVKANLGEPVYPHLLRHTFATNLLAKGLRIEQIEVLMGHSSVGTTEIYAENNIDKIVEEYNKKN